MGLFKNMKGAVDAANEAAGAAQQYQQPGGMGGMMGMGNLGQMAAAQGSLQAQAHEFNRILTVGQPGNALIRSHVGAGEQVAGNPVWIFDLEVTPQGGAPS